MCRKKRIAILSCLNFSLTRSRHSQHCVKSAICHSSQERFVRYWRLNCSLRLARARQAQISNLRVVVRRSISNLLPNRASVCVRELTVEITRSTAVILHGLRVVVQVLLVRTSFIRFLQQEFSSPRRRAASISCSKLACENARRTIPSSSSTNNSILCLSTTPSTCSVFYFCDRFPLTCLLVGWRSPCLSLSPSERLFSLF